MADELVEGSVYNQIKAIEGWAINAYQESLKKNPNVGEILENLRKINLQARKLEWRGKGLDSLPKGQQSEDLKKKITQLRAAVVTLRDIKKDKELSSASKRTIRVLTEVAAEAIKLSETLASVPFEQFNTNPALLEDFLRGEGNFAHLTQEMRRILWNSNTARAKIQLRNLNLSGVDLSGFNFNGMYLKNCDLSNVNLSKVTFIKSQLVGCQLKKAKIDGANFTQSIINGSGLSADQSRLSGEGMSFHKCNIINYSFWFSQFNKVDFSFAIFKEVYFDNTIFTECNLQNARFRVMHEKVSKNSFDAHFEGCDLRNAFFDLTDFNYFGNDNFGGTPAFQFTSFN